MQHCCVGLLVQYLNGWHKLCLPLYQCRRARWTSSARSPAVPQTQFRNSCNRIIFRKCLGSFPKSNIGYALCQSTYSPKFDENPPVPFWVILLTNRDSGRNITPFTPTCPFTSKLSRPALSRLWRRLPLARGYDVATNAPAPCCRSWVAHVAKRHQVSIVPANTGVQSESKINFWGKIFQRLWILK